MLPWPSQSKIKSSSTLVSFKQDHREQTFLLGILNYLSLIVFSAGTQIGTILGPVLAVCIIEVLLVSNILYYFISDVTIQQKPPEDLLTTGRSLLQNGAFER